MSNEYVNKVTLGADTLIDLTSDTATEDAVAYGYAFHLPSGAPATGRLEPLRAGANVVIAEGEISVPELTATQVANLLTDD